MKHILLLLALLSTTLLQAQDSIVRKTYTAIRAEKPPHIDGEMDDEVWAKAEVGGNMVQASPNPGAQVMYPTEFRLVYDDNAIYIFGKMYDPHPDSIMQQLGVRDASLTADAFRMVFDTYNTQQDAFDFSVYSSGVQADSRFSDANYDAVWKSAVSKQKDGWTCEVMIPYFALRFSTAIEQIWGFQITRSFNRPKYSEFDQWSLTPRNQANPLRYWGKLLGIKSIKAPLRLSLTPYLGTIVEKDGTSDGSPVSKSLSGGLDLKYGINESFTLDATLLPDFSQVQSDNIVKNLRAFEVQYAEQRPFFTEGVDLFSKGRLFYSRRIGRTPSGFYDAPYMLNENEHLIKNPSQSRLLNASKISGRMSNGTGVGILNAIIDNTYAVAEDSTTGTQRQILTEPRSNYNVFVLDKQMKNSSSIFLMNNNVMRSHGYNSSNVTASGFSLNDKNSRYYVYGNGAVTNILTPDTVKGQFLSTLGASYETGFGKQSGWFKFGLGRSGLSPNYNANDLGITFETNFIENSAWTTFSMNKPHGIFNQGELNYNFTHQQNFTTKSTNSVSMNINGWGQLRNFSSVYFGVGSDVIDSRDYYEPRTPGRYYLRTRNINVWGGYNGNFNKKLTPYFNFYTGTTARISPTIPANPWIGGGASLNWRVGDRLSLSPGISPHNDFGDRGWVNTESDGTIVIGRRNIRNIENTIQASYIFMRDMSMTLNARHYWSTGHYLGYYVLQEDGTLHDYVNYSGNHDFSFNYFSIDLVYKWIFAPGSTLSVAWKQIIQQEQTAIDYNYINDFKNTVNSPQVNRFSIRVLYFLDYRYVTRMLQKHDHGKK